MDSAINELKACSGKEECLRKAYGILSNRYRGHRGKTYAKLLHLFHTDIQKNWKKTGFLHCTNINKIFKHLLLESGFFNPEEVVFKWTLIWYISPHQYARVKLDGGWVNIDIWAKPYGIEFGDYAHGFH